MKKEEFNKHKWLKRKIHSSSFRGNQIEQLEQVVYESEQMRKQLSETEEKLKLSYRSIVDNCIQDEGDYGECIYCHEGGWGYPDQHKPDCIVLEAQTWLEDKE